MVLFPVSTPPDPLGERSNGDQYRKAAIGYRTRRRSDLAALGAGAAGPARAAHRGADGRLSRKQSRSTGGRSGVPGQRFAKELVGSQPELILSTNTPATAALLQQTRTIPIVFVQVTDPVGSGFIESIPRPGGNVTGFITMPPTMATKWLDLLKEIAPRVKRVAFLFNPETEIGRAHV